MERLSRPTLDQLVPWLVRVLWVALPFTAGPALADALDPASAAVRTLASTGLWAGWAVGVGAAFIRHPVALTALRVLAPAAVAAVVAAALGGHPSALAMGWAAVTCAWTFAPPVGAAWVNGPAYPNERRFLLRVPGPLVFGPLGVAWAAAAAGLVSGPLLLAARQWVAGAFAVAAGVPLAVLLVRGLHTLTRRWLVFVPAGVVLHDPMTLVDPVLFRRQLVSRLGPAPVSTDAVDLTQRALGLAMELALTEPVEVMLLRPGRRLGDRQQVERLMFTPTRPGAVLDEARARRVRVGDVGARR